MSTDVAAMVAWLGECLDEDERVARRAASYDDGASHDVQGPEGTWTCLDESEWFGPSYRGGTIAPRIGYANAPELGAHIARHDPARVLDEVAAKRRRIELLAEAIEQGGDSYDLATELLPLEVAAYRHRPGCRPEWLPEHART